MSPVYDRVGLAVAGGWGIHTPRLSSVAPGFNSLADPVCRGYTLTRVTHGLDRDLVPLTTMHE